MPNHTIPYNLCHTSLKALFVESLSLPPQAQSIVLAFFHSFHPRTRHNLVTAPSAKIKVCKLELRAYSYGESFPDIFPVKWESRSAGEILCNLSYGDVFPLFRGNYDHVTCANKDTSPALPGKCAHMVKCFLV